jgi:hypothetical protein
MTSINPALGVSVPLAGTFAQEAPIARNSNPLAQPAAAAASSGPVAVPADAMAQAVTRLASVQGGLAPLFADLAAAAGRSDLPQAVQGAAQTLLSLGLDGAALNGKAIEAALSKSGVFLEGALARGEAIQGDLKLALLSLRNALRSALPEGARVPAPSSSLPPPHRGALPVGEPPSLPSIAMLDGDTVGLKLLSETDAALARTTLLQVASLPDASQGNTTQRLVVDIPIATPQGHAVIQLQVEPDDEHRNGPGEERSPSWRINLAIDIEPLGPVRARITQIEGRTHVNLYAEREEAARALRDDLPALQTQLAEAALEPGDLHCRSGVPQSEPARPGLFVDRAS